MRKPNLSLAFFILLPFLISSCSRSKIKLQKEWGTYFKEAGVEGCLMLHDYHEGVFDVYKLEKMQDRTLPAETFNVVIAMAGLETGVIPDTSSILPPDSTVENYSSGLSLAAAFKTSNTPYFQQVVKAIGKKRMNYWIDSTYYGNKKMGHELDSFWLNNTLQISPDEQVGLMERLYFGKLAFQPRTQRLMKSLLIKKETHNDTLCYQTGVGHAGNQKTGWIIGWFKQKDHPFFFSLKTVAADSISNLDAKDLNILYKALNNKGLIKEDGRIN